MILYLLLFLLVWLSPVASDWPWSYAVQGVAHYSWILFHLLLCNIIKFKPRISKFCTIYNHLNFCCWVEAVISTVPADDKYNTKSKINQYYLLLVCSSLKCDLFGYNLITSCNCDCGNYNESVDHFFLKCNIYTERRIQQAWTIWVLT